MTLNTNKRQKILEIGESVLSCEIAGLQKLYAAMDDSFIQIIDLLLSVEGKIILTGIGKSGYVARKIASTLASTGSKAVFLHPAEAAHGDMGIIGNKDVIFLLSNSGETRELRHIIYYCKRSGIPMISMTMHSDSTIANASDISLVLPESQEASPIGAPTTSSVMMMVYGDIIAVVLQQLKSFEKSHYKELHPAGSIGARLLQAKELMHHGNEMPIVKHNTSCVEAILEITAKRLGCTGVLDDKGKLIGIITDGDLRRHINTDFRTTKASDIMTYYPITIKPEFLLPEVINMMQSHLITNVFVVDKSKHPLGIIHMHDLLKVAAV